VLAARHHHDRTWGVQRLGAGLTFRDDLSNGTTQKIARDIGLATTRERLSCPLARGIRHEGNGIIEASAWSSAE
jgi:hypothetical protein